MSCMLGNRQYELPFPAMKAHGSLFDPLLRRIRVTTAGSQEQTGPRRVLATRAAASPLLTIFLITILLPISMEVAGLRLSPNRLYLLVFSVPFAIKVIQGAAGRFTFVDLTFILFGLWIMLALVVSHGTERIPFAGINVVEMVGGYFVGRILVRNLQDYNAMIRFILIAMAYLLPVALIEATTGKMILPDLFRIVFDAPYRGDSAYGRMGLERVYSVFDHPILFGLFCSTALANVFYLFAARPTLALFAATFTLGMSFLSLSSAPLLACAMQIGLLVWNRIMGGRWTLFLILSVILYVALDLASNRTPITIIIETMTFNSGTGWTRIATNQFGWASVWTYPIFGLGFNDWARPDWLTSSVDNFWLVTAMRYGFVGFILIVTSFFFHMLMLCRAQISGNDVTRCRTAYGITLAAICFTLITVHVWDTMATFVMFFVGAGAWMYTSDSNKTEMQTEPPPESGNRPRYTRFDRNTPRSSIRVKQESSLK